MTGALVAEDRDGLRARARAVMTKMDLGDGDADAFLDDKRGAWIVGTVDEVVDRLGGLGDIGVARVMLQHLPHRDLEMVELVGERVIPAL